MFNRVFRCRNCLARFPDPAGVQIEGSDAALGEVNNAIDTDLAGDSHMPIAHECEQGGFGIADYVGVMLA
jgi:hypothetical protein